MKTPKLTRSSELWAVQLLLFSEEGSWFNSVTFLELNVGWLSFFFSCLLVELSSDKRNNRKISSTLHSAFFKHHCGNWAVFSVAPHWLEMSMSQWTKAFASGAERSAWNSFNQFSFGLKINKTLCVNITSTLTKPLNFLRKWTLPTFWVLIVFQQC